MTMRDIQVANGVARHSVPDDFKTFAEPELRLVTPWEAGVCFLPECGKPFTPARRWQIYCCSACERAATAELRRWGHRMALSALVWRMHKHRLSDPNARALGAAARRHVGAVQSAWLTDRRARAVDASQVRI